MVGANWQKAKSKAEEILRENHISEPPVPVVELIQNYGYEVKEVELPFNVAGFVDPKKRVVYVNAFDSDTRKAFTVAHELGHIVLHSEALEKDPNIGVLLRQPLGRRTEDELEQEANCFAANLLVPYEMFEEKRETYGRLATTKILGNLFGVSPEVIRYRLHDLEISSQNA